MAAWNETIRTRAAIMREGLDLSRLHGLEIGALCYPMVHRSDGPITYVDHATAEALRATYADDVSIRPQDIVEVDAVWGTQTLSDCLGGARVDYIMASHVAEHVPDLITWLAECRSVLKPGGQLRLALPDCRFSHDAKRAETRLSDLLAAYVLRVRKPQVRDVLDFRLLSATGIDGNAIFHGTARAEEAMPDVAFELAVETAGWARDYPDHYFDVHCLVAQPRGFARLMEQLARQGLLPLACAAMRDTAPPLFEFYVFATPCDDPGKAAESWGRVQESLHDPLPGSAAGRASSKALDDALAARDAAQAELGRLQRSVSWRLTGPLRRVRARMRR